MAEIDRPMSPERGKGYTEINFAKGEIPYSFFPSPVQEAIDKARFIREANQSVVGPGLDELRELLVVRSNERHGTAFHMDQVVMTAGSSEAFAPILKQFDRRTTQVVVADISYADYEDEATELGFDVAKFRLTEDFLPDIDSIKDILKGGNKLLFLNNPNNPTGQVYPEPLLQQIADAVDASPGSNIVVDEVFEESYLDGDGHSSAANTLPNKTYTVKSFSKWGPFAGLRLGYVVTPPGKEGSVLKARKKVAAFPAFMQYAAIPVARGDCDDVIEDCRNGLRRGRAEMHERLTNMGLSTPWPKAGFFLIPDVSELGGGDEVAVRLERDYNLIVVKGSGYGDAAKDRIRVSYSLPRDMRNAGMDRFQQALNKW